MVAVSILIGRVSTEDRDRLLETLEALRGQATAADYEVVVADRLQDELTGRIERDFPEVVMIRSAAGATLPELRTRALRRAKGRIVAVTEDHCVPDHGWLDELRKLDDLPDDVAALGGPVINGLTERRLDWATYLCEYAAFAAPLEDGPTFLVPGMNLGYRRELLIDRPDDLLNAGFWETVLHPKLRAEGYRFWSSNRLRMLHRKRFSLRLFLRQRYVYSRYFAGLRFPEEARGLRFAAAGAALLLPPLLLYRMVRAAWAKPGLPLLAALPYLVPFVAVWAWGEAVGYAAGGGGALAEIE